MRKLWRGWLESEAIYTFIPTFLRRDSMAFWVTIRDDHTSWENGLGCFMPPNPKGQWRTPTIDTVQPSQPVTERDILIGKNKSFALFTGCGFADWLILSQFWRKRCSEPENRSIVMNAEHGHGERSTDDIIFF